MLFTFFIYSIMAHGTSYDEGRVFAYFTLLQKKLPFFKVFHYKRTLNQVNFISHQRTAGITVEIFDQVFEHR